MSKLRIYFIGIAMGIADLIPGISGGTIAFMSGIYEPLLTSIKTLRLDSFKKINWPFLLPLGGGIITAILLFSKLFYFLLFQYKEPLFGFFFGLILASTLVCARKAKVKKVKQLLPILGGAIISFILTLLPAKLIFGSNFWGIALAGTLAASAMLLPGISGSFVLQVIGVYPLVICAVALPTQAGSLQLLMTLSIGICLGFILFSRVISFLLARFHTATFLTLVGFMLGGIKALWPFAGGLSFATLSLTLAGFFLVILLEIKLKHKKAPSTD